MMSAVMRAVLLLLLLALPAGAQQVEFRLAWLAVHGTRQLTLNYDVDGDGKADCFNASIDFQKDPPERWLSLHLNRGGSFAKDADHVWPLSDRASVLVFGDFLPGGGTEIGFLAEDGVYAHPWEAGRPLPKPVKLLHARTFFRRPAPKQIPVWQFKMDLDGDGRDDLLVPLDDGYRAYFQTAPGTFGRVATLEADLPEGGARRLAASGAPVRPETAPVQFTFSRELPKLETVDINGDGLRDLVLIQRDVVTYYLQKAGGEFPSARPFRVSFRVPTLAEEAKKDTVDLATVRFVDIDRDGLADLVVTRVSGELGLWDSIQTSIYLHLGTGKGNFVADKRIAIDGVSIDPEFIDLDGDGKLDAATSRFRTDLMKQAVSAFVLGDVAISYEIFQFDPAGGGFLPDPVFEKVLFVPRKDIEKTGIGAVPMVFFRGDLSGDGRPDMVVLDPKTQELQIHPGVVRETGSGKRIGYDGTAHWRVKVGRHPRALAVADANGDGANDVLLYFDDAVGFVQSARR
jgi:hypothetical protein